MPAIHRLFTRRVGPLGLALTAWDIWRRIPPRQRKLIRQQVRKHGPRVARQVMQKRRRRP
jgi:hypothetical protein